MSPAGCVDCSKKHVPKISGSGGLATVAGERENEVTDRISRYAPGEICFVLAFPEISHLRARWSFSLFVDAAQRSCDQLVSNMFLFSTSRLHMLFCTCTRGSSVSITYTPEYVLVSDTPFLPHVPVFGGMD